MQRAWLRHAIRPAHVSSAEVNGAGRPAASARPISARRVAAWDARWASSRKASSSAGGSEFGVAGREPAKASTRA